MAKKILTMSLQVKGILDVSGKVVDDVVGGMVKGVRTRRQGCIYTL